MPHRTSFNSLLIVTILSLSPVPASPSTTRSTLPSDATVVRVELPQAIVDVLEIATRSGTCEKSWRDLASGSGMVREWMDESTELFLVPCAHWAHNVGSMVFARIKEASSADGFLTLPLRFVDHSSTEGLVARELVYNYDWNREKKTIRSHFYLNGKEQCGSDAQYSWNSGQQNFVLDVLYKNDDCTQAQPNWTAVYRRGH